MKNHDDTYFYVKQNKKYVELAAGFKRNQINYRYNYENCLDTIQEEEIIIYSPSSEDDSYEDINFLKKQARSSKKNKK